MPRSVSITNGSLDERYTIATYAFAAAPTDPVTGESDPLQGAVDVTCRRELILNDQVIGTSSLGFGARTQGTMQQLLALLGARMAERLAEGGIVLTPEQVEAVLIPAYLEGTREALYDLGKAVPNAIPAEAV